jgi:hypothetical protein
MGLIGYGLLHFAIAWLAIEIAVWHSKLKADQAGAFYLLKRQPLGKVLLIIIAVGLGAMALWQLLLAAVGQRQYTGKRRTLERLGSLGRVIVYAFLLWTAIKVLTSSTASSSKSQEKMTAGVLGDPLGEWLVAIGGVIVFAIGIGMIIYGFKRAFAPKLALGSLSKRARTGILTLGQVGYIAKGLAFAVVGALLFDAAIADNAHRSNGLDGALRELAAQPFGTFLLSIVALGFAAFGLYCFAQSRYRKI